jgi:hypothetical protein
MLTIEQRNSRQVRREIGRLRGWWPETTMSDVQAFFDSWGILRIGWVDRSRHRADAMRERSHR